MRGLVAGAVPEAYQHTLTPHVALTGPMIPDTDSTTVYDYVFSKEKGTWVTWQQLMEPLDIPEGAGFADILVPTIDSTR